MELGLIGLPQSGKTTIFTALTGQEMAASHSVAGQLTVEMAVVEVPDPRLDALTDMFNPKKKVPARITYQDIGGLAKGISEGGLAGPFRNQLSQMDGYLHIIRAFESAAVPHPEESIDPQRDLEIIDTELLFTDLAAVENRIIKLKEAMDRGKNRDTNPREIALFERLQAHLEENKPLREMELNEDELTQMRSFGFLTLKPKLVVVNLGDEAVDPTTLVRVEGAKVDLIGIQGALEAEIAQLDEDDAAMFMDEYGISEPSRARIINASYRLLDTNTFFTVGEDECRAWPYPARSTAQEAAGKIHSDLQRGFIRAEIIHEATLRELGSMAEAKSQGKLRLEGREYIVQDGDIMNVRFKV
ncbi:MAG: redox-regulated ATPase YchF [Chloroflexi bacterium]|nr:redox-regulated ATPase YchF [Chloroflexota bacterium]